LRNAKELIKKLLTQKIITTFQITLDVPSDYKYMVQEPDFIWLKKELVRNTSLLLYQVPINAIKNKDNLVSNIIKMRDSVGALYIHGKEPNTDMITEEAYSPYFFKIKLVN
jgi:hypothetical protein